MTNTIIIDPHSIFAVGFVIIILMLVWKAL